MISRKLPVKSTGIRLFNKWKIKRNEKKIKENLSIELNNITDDSGEGLSNREFNEYYQYREFFVKNKTSGHEGITENLMDKNIPVIQNKVSDEIYPDTSWLNTPLIEEDILTGNLFSSIDKQNNYLRYQFKNNENRLNEIVYMHIDREIYSLNDTLWFKGYIRNKGLLTPSSYSKSFFVQLVNSSGEIILI